jgi:hypothetical protein
MYVYMYIHTISRTNSAACGASTRLPLPGIRRKVLALRYYKDMRFFFTAQASTRSLALSRALSQTRVLSLALSRSLHMCNTCCFAYAHTASLLHRLLARSLARSPSLARAHSLARSLSRCLSRALSPALYMQQCALSMCNNALLLCMYPSCFLFLSLHKIQELYVCLLARAFLFIYFFKIQELGLRRSMRALCFHVP